MKIQTKTKSVDVTSVLSTNIIHNGKSYPALKFIFPGAITAEDIAALTSGSISIDKNPYDGYTTMGDVSITIGKVTTAEAERDAIQAKHEETISNVNKILPRLDDATALTVKSLFPTWEAGKPYAVDNRIVYGDKLYKVITNHTSQADWTPDVSASLFTVINETHAGTVEDPIPYSGNMALTEGLYYVQDGVIYVCTRDTINPVYNALGELVGQYTELVE